MLMDVIVLGLCDKQGADDCRDQGNDDRVPQSVIDVALESDQRERCRGQQSAKPSVTDVIGQ